jgi:hypothetical protein
VGLALRVELAGVLVDVGGEELLLAGVRAEVALLDPIRSPEEADHVGLAVDAGQDLDEAVLVRQLVAVALRLIGLEAHALADAPPGHADEARAAGAVEQVAEHRGARRRHVHPLEGPPGDERSEKTPERVVDLTILR